MILSEAELRRVQRLRLNTGRVRTAAQPGERRSTRKGAGQEFADYRNYAPGDDLRRLDWRAYARLDRPFIKLYEEEQDLAVYLLLDASQSMDWGEGPAHKFRYALRVAGALGAAALAGGDRLTVFCLNAEGDKPLSSLGPLQGAQNTLLLLRFLEAAAAGGTTDLAAALTRLAGRLPRPGLVILISDLLSPSPWLAGLAALQAGGHTCAVVQILSPAEIEPDIDGDLRLLDSETGAALEVSLDSRTLELYRRRLFAWREQSRAGAHERGIRFASFSSALPWEQVVFQELRREGIVR